MSELKFIETTDETIYTDILEELENGVGEPLYPGDERRIFGDTMAKVIVTVYNTVNDACRQKMLRYARGTVLDALGENRDVIRLDPTYATTTLRFTVTEAVGSNIIIPAGLRVTGDFVHYFLTDTTAVLYAGSLYVDVAATAEEGGTDYNNIDEGEISEIVDVSDVPLLDGVTNLTITEGGGDREEDEPYRERIRELTSENRRLRKQIKRMREAAATSKKVEFSKIIFCGVSIVTILITVFSCWIIYSTMDASALAYLIPAVFAEMASATGFYYTKAKAENKIKLMNANGVQPEAENFNDF